MRIRKMIARFHLSDPLEILYSWLMAHGVPPAIPENLRELYGIAIASYQASFAVSDTAHGL